MTLKLLSRNGVTTMLVAIAVSGFGVSAYAAPAGDDGRVHPIGETKKVAKKVGHGVKKSTKVVGHGFRDGAKAVGHGTRDATRAIGHAFRDVGK
jgi:hypothetical protein